MTVLLGLEDKAIGSVSVFRKRSDLPVLHRIEHMRLAFDTAVLIRGVSSP